MVACRQNTASYHVARLLAIALALAFASGVLGCVSIQQRLETRFASEYHCPRKANKVKIKSLGGNSYRVRGCRMQVTYTCVGSACVVDNMQDYRAPVARPSQPRKPAASSKVRSSRDLAGHVTIDGAAWQPEFRVRVVGTPAKDAGMVSLKLQLKAAPTDAASECGLQFVADGFAMEFPGARYRRSGANHEVVAAVTLANVQQLASASRVVGGVCDARLQLLPDHIQMLREFVVRYREEATLGGSEVPAPSKAGNI